MDKVELTWAEQRKCTIEIVLVEIRQNLEHRIVSACGGTSSSVNDNLPGICDGDTIAMPFRRTVLSAVHADGGGDASGCRERPSHRKVHSG